MHKIKQGSIIVTMSNSFPVTSFPLGPLCSVCISPDCIPLSSKSSFNFEVFLWPVTTESFFFLVFTISWQDTKILLQLVQLWEKKLAFLCNKFHPGLLLNVNSFRRKCFLSEPETQNQWCLHCKVKYLERRTQTGTYTLLKCVCCIRQKVSKGNDRIIPRLQKNKSSKEAAFCFVSHTLSGAFAPEFGLGWLNCRAFSCPSLFSASLPSFIAPTFLLHHSSSSILPSFLTCFETFYLTSS